MKTYIIDDKEISVIATFPVSAIEAQGHDPETFCGLIAQKFLDSNVSYSVKKSKSEFDAIMETAKYSEIEKAEKKYIIDNVPVFIIIYRNI